jgi:integrase/recombinase XerD
VLRLWPVAKPTPPNALIRRSLTPFENAAEAVIKAKRSEHTRDAYRGDLRRWIAFCASHRVDPAQPTIMVTTAFRDALRASMSEDGARRKIAAMSSIYSTLLKGGAASANPFHPAVLAWPPASKIPKTQLVSDDVALAMIAHAEADPSPRGLRDAAILRLLYDTGLRRESIATLQREYYQPPTLRAIVKGGSPVELELPPSSIAALDQWLNYSTRPTGYMFYGARSSPIHVTAINRLVSARGEAVGAKGVHPHRFRTSFITSGYDARLPEYEIQAGAHHKDLKTTRRYDRGTRGVSTAVNIAKFRKGRA